MPFLVKYFEKSFTMNNSSAIKLNPIAPKNKIGLLRPFIATNNMAAIAKIKPK